MYLYNYFIFEKLKLKLNAKSTLPYGMSTQQLFELMINY